MDGKAVLDSLSSAHLPHSCISADKHKYICHNETLSLLHACGRPSRTRQEVTFLLNTSEKRTGGLSAIVILLFCMCVNVCAPLVHLDG